VRGDAAQNVNQNPDGKLTFLIMDATRPLRKNLI